MDLAQLWEWQMWLTYRQGFHLGLPVGSIAPFPAVLCCKEWCDYWILCDTLSLQMQLTTDTCDPQSLEPRPKKQRTEQMEKSLTDPNETKCFNALCSSHSLKFPEELQMPSKTFNKVWKTCFHCVVERGFHFHENVGSARSPEGVMTIQLAAIHVSEEIKNPAYQDLDTHAHIQAHIC